MVISFRWGSVAYASSDGRIQVGSLVAVVDDYSPWETDPPGTSGGANFMAFGPDDTDGNSPTGDWVAEVRQTSQTNVVPREYIDNQPLCVGNPNADFVDGDGTMRVTVHYATFEL